MIKKGILCLFIFLLQINTVQGLEGSIASNAGACVLLDASTGQILYASNETEKLYPASTTKIMTMILLFEAIHDGTISFDDIVTTSKEAAGMGGSQIYLKEGETMSVHDMFKAIAIASANDASVAMAQKIGGSTQNFVSMMNDKAKDLGLKNTHFCNPTGLHENDHYTSAYDLGKMAQYLLKIGGQDLLDVTSLYDSYIREDSEQKFWLVNTNKLLKLYDGVDGLKTGFTKEAGYCLVATVEKDNMRLIGVVMNESLPDVRNQEMMNLLNYGYANFQAKQLYKKGEVIDTCPIQNSKTKTIPVIVKEDVYIVENTMKKSKVTQSKEYTITTPPIYENKPIGTLSIKVDGKKVQEVDLYSQITLKKETILDRIWNCFQEFF